ncbi:MAG: sulfatase [Trueperaceae bacterium]|nr:sulfatase [Trueperaceae bacterium]
MKAIMVMFDSLNRHMLPPYGCDFVHAPNFERLAEKAIQFNRSYVGSMPCMPARRELHTGRYNFLHRSWGPLEPFDESMPELLKKAGVYTHLVTDHQHYFEDGGGTYHTRYNSWEFMRGQEGDTWKGQVENPTIPETAKAQTGMPMWRQDWVNRQHLIREEDMPQAKTFAAGLEFIDTNHRANNWFLQIETFDPHEPFFTQQKYKDLYPHDYVGKHFDWPDYSFVTQNPEEVQHCRYEYAALVSMCDHYLGTVLDKMDALNLWDDTLLIVNTDHGFLLGEKDWWAKMVQPMYNEVAHTPLFIWDPRCKLAGETREALVQTIDLAPTLLEFFDVPIPETMEGVSLRDSIQHDALTREAGLFGQHGSHVNVTDGRYVYMRGPTPKNEPLFDYTLMPTRMRQRFTPEELQGIELVAPFAFSKDCSTLKAEAKAMINPYIYGTLLFDLEADPQQENPLQDEVLERKMIGHLLALMKKNDAPAEQYERLGLPLSGDVDASHLRCSEKRAAAPDQIGQTPVVWQGKGKSLYYGFLGAMPVGVKRQFELGFEQALNTSKKQELNQDDVLELFQTIIPKENYGMVNFVSHFVLAKGL